MPAFSEFLIADSAIVRRYLIESERHTPEILALWTPLVDRLMDAPGERLFHGMIGCPYWEVSAELPGFARHPELDEFHWLSFYGSPDREQPYYVGLLALLGRDAASGVGLICALSGSPGHASRAPLDAGIATVVSEVGRESPALAGCYLLGELFGLPDPDQAARSTGECAAIVAQIMFSRLIEVSHG